VPERNVQRTLWVRSYQTAWTMLHRYRRAMANPNWDLLTGTVEVCADRPAPASTHYRLL
jgi:hypothetical protein